MSSKFRILEGDYLGGGVVLTAPVQFFSGAIRADDGDGWVYKARLTHDEAERLAKDLASAGFGPGTEPEPEPEKPKGIGDMSELEYLRSLVFELSKK